jgi:cyclase
VQRERVSKEIYVFTSELYAHVTAGAIVSRDGVVIIDTMPLPVESRDMASYVARVSGLGQQYLVLTHYHADHSYGTCFFPNAVVVAHAECRELLKTVAEPALMRAKLDEPDLEDVRIRLPDVTFDSGEMALQVGGRVVRLISVPGNTPDAIMVYDENDRVLFAGDTVMPVPSIVDGDINALRVALSQVAQLPVENLVQGHGDVVLRGEVPDIVDASLAYLDAIEDLVARAVQSGDSSALLMKSDIEECGMSRVPLNGLVQQIHRANLLSLYERASRK